VLKVDDLKLWYFERSCRDAKEIIYKKEAGESLVMEIHPWSKIMQEDGYYPSDLARDLLSPPNQLSSLQVVLDVPPDKAVASCVGRYIHNIRSPKEAYQTPNCNTERPNENSTIIAPYTLQYVYGDKNFFDVMPLKLSLTNTKTGEVIAMQNTYMLLLGNMHSAKNKRWYGWGSAEGAKMCKLTPPKNFIASVLTTNQ